MKRLGSFFDIVPPLASAFIMVCLAGTVMMSTGAVTPVQLTAYLAASCFILCVPTILALVSGIFLPVERFD